MGQFNIQSLMSDIRPDSPCGEDISYDVAYLELERLLQPDAGGVIQDVVSEEPDWIEIGNRSYALLRRSKNLRVALYLTLARLKLEGFSGLKEGLSLLRDHIERYWQDVYPRLDPDDNFDSLERQNILASLSLQGGMQDPMKFMQHIAGTPLCESRQLGRFSFRDIQIAKGLLAIPGRGEENKPTMTVIDAAFQDVSPEVPAQTCQIIETCLGHLNAIAYSFASQSVQRQSPSFESLRSLLEDISKYMQSRCPVEEQSTFVEETMPQQGQTSAIGRLSGEILSPQDAIEAIERICRYYEQHEPSSPVPLLLRRAKRLVSASFAEVIRDICPDAVSQVEQVSGINTLAPPEQS